MKRKFRKNAGIEMKLLELAVRLYYGSISSAGRLLFR